MKKLNKPPSINRNDYVATNPKKLSDGFNFNYGFIFSDELPYMRKNKAQKNKEYRRSRKS